MVLTEFALLITKRKVIGNKITAVYENWWRDPVVLKLWFLDHQEYHLELDLLEMRIPLLLQLKPIPESETLGVGLQSVATDPPSDSGCVIKFERNV